MVFKSGFIFNCCSSLVLRPSPSTFLTTVPPQIMSFDFGDEVSNFDDSTATQCMAAKGDLPITFKWYLNDEPIFNDSEGIQITRVAAKLSTLRIDALNGKHRGVYTCEVQNKAGVAKFSAELKLNGEEKRRIFVKLLTTCVCFNNLFIKIPLSFHPFLLHHHHGCTAVFDCSYATHQSVYL